MILMPETTAAAAMKAAERLRGNVNKMILENNAGEINLSISVGVASRDKSCKSLEQLFERADYASYVSKDLGGNRVTRWTGSLSRNRGEMNGKNQA